MPLHFIKADAGRDSGPALLGRLSMLDSGDGADDDYLIAALGQAVFLLFLLLGSELAPGQPRQANSLGSRAR